jgi:hypothetical protein
MLEQAGVQLSFVLFRKIFPVKPEIKLSDSEMQALAKVYTKWEIISVPFMFFYIALTGYFWFLLLRYIGDLAAQPHEECLFLEVPSAMTCMLPAMFLGFISSVVPLIVTMKALLGERYEEYIRWSSQRQGFDAWKVFYWMAVAYVIGSLCFEACSLRYWEAFHKDRVVLMRPWYLSSRTYPYTRVKGIAHLARFQAPNGNIRNDPYFMIRFDDGETWSSSRGAKLANVNRANAIIDLVSKQSGRPVEQLDLIADWK